ncbi:DUF4333 domain-containing protein [Amycolatopsis rhabdoformis]|uniref:DUF4333 domain-containing protein n=1 Tax=Amycolatopsis rhabdoformis TaxID=1448059 RepID=A0ABZ1IH23_9PSEU|nr:DUF4333 domain-containing protein [Amycolatopsis rhabdoformis]WSE33056.1 DUF4333 domain-containing protein [Amycolatopsis rhabdoformis]
MRAVTVLGLCGLGLLITTGCSSKADPAGSVTTVTVTPTTTAPDPSSGSPGATPASGSASSTGPARVFDAKAMDAAVAKLLADTYKIEGVGEVSCPDRQAVTDGSAFQCVVDLSGEQKHVLITVTGTSGDYRVDPPK